MADSLETQLEKRAREISLTPTEKRERKKEFLAFMSEHPAENGGEVLTWSQQLLRNIAGARVLHSPLPYIAGITMITITGGGISYMANSALPGDTLYPIKVSINEELIGLTHTTAKSKARYEARRLSERLDEVNRLTSSDRVNSKVWHEMSLSLEAHITNIKGYINAQDIDTTVATGTLDLSVQTETPTPSTGTTSTNTSPSVISSSTSTIATTSTSTQETTLQQEDTSKQLLEIQEHLDGNTEIPEEEQNKLEDLFTEAATLFRKGLSDLEAERHQKAISLFTRAQEIVRKINKMLQERERAETSALRADAPEKLTATGTPATASSSSALE